MAVVSLVLESELGAVTLCDACHVAETPAKRMRGLLGRRELEPGEGLLLRPAPAIHTLFMRFPIDAVFLNGDLRVVHIADRLKPWRMAAAKGASAVLELPAGECERRGLRVGDQLGLGGFSMTRNDSSSPAWWAGARPVPRAGAREILVGLLAAVLAAASVARFGIGAHGLIAAMVTCVLVVLAAVDLERRIIPNRIVLPATGVVLFAQIAAFPDRAGEWILASVGTALFLAIPLIFNPKAIGLGDVKLGLLLGAALGRDVLGALMLGFLAAFPVALFLFARDGAAAKRIAIPLGPFLALGTIVALFVYT